MLKDMGIAGSMCCSFFDRNGNFMEPEISRRLIGVRLTELRKALVWVFAGDYADTQALLGALKTGRVAILSVTCAKAQAVLDLLKEAV